MPRKTVRIQIVTDELLSKVNPKNKSLLELFLKEKATRSSELTIKNYRSDANIFFCWNVIHNENKFFVEMKKLELASFFSFVVDELHWGSSRVNRVRSFLSSLSIFIERFLDDEYPDFRNIVLKTIESIPKELRREKTILTDEQVQELLEWLSKNNIQAACWLALAVYSGSRFAELLRFTTDILDENHTAFGDLFMETKGQIKTKGRGKSGKLLYKYILKEKFIPYYKSWLNERSSIMERSGETHNFLFVKDDGSPMTEGIVRGWISKMEEHLGCNLYPHALRHFLTTELSRKNIPALLIKDLFGWSSLEMVNLYTDLTAKDREWKELENLR